MTTDAPGTTPDTQDADEIRPGQSVTEHDTLKYHLLGPSLTKAGQDSVDQNKVTLLSPVVIILFNDLVGFRNHLQCL